MHTIEFNATTFTDPIIAWMNKVIPAIPGALLGLLMGILVVRLLTRLSRFLLNLTSIPKGLRQIITSAIEILLWLLLLVQLLRILGFGDILVFFSSSALAIGILLAAGGSTLLSDLVAGIFLARDGDFTIGDEVKAGENQIEGIIESMDVRRVRIRDKEGLLHVLPNSVVERKEWVLVRKRTEVKGGLEKAVITAKRLKTVALETRAAVVGKKVEIAERKAAKAEQKAIEVDKKLSKAEKTARVRKSTQ